MDSKVQAVRQCRGITPQDLLTTTRSVRRRLDLQRPVPAELIRASIEIACQAPSGANHQAWHWIVVTDAEKRRFIGERYKMSWYAWYASSAAGRPTYDEADPRRAQQPRMYASARHLADRMGEVPVLVIAGIEGRVEGADNLTMSGLYGSILPAVWSFMLAARLRGLGTVYTTLHLRYEKEISEMLGIPYERVTQAALLPVAYYTGEGFRAPKRIPLDRIVHWDTW